MSKSRESLRQSLLARPAPSDPYNIRKLGGALRDNQLLLDVQPSLAASDFYVFAYQKSWEALQDLYVRKPRSQGRGFFCCAIRRHTLAARD
jgi:hypothetical protein